MPERFSLSVVSNTLRNGGVIAYPTEAVFGLGCDPNNTSALQHLIAIKHRSPTGGFILIGDSLECVMPFIKAPDAKTIKNIQATWPGPTTWILPARDVHPLVTGGRTTVAVRVTDHPICQNLCKAFGGPITSTSANISGKPPAKTPLQVMKTFGNQLDGIVHGALGTSTTPTTIIDAATGHTLR